MSGTRAAVTIVATTIAAIWLLGHALDRPCSAEPTDSSPSGGFQPPGAEPLPPGTAKALAAALAAKGPGYRPHTRHLRPDGSPKYTNRLILEDSRQTRVETGGATSTSRLPRMLAR